MSNYLFHTFATGSPNRRRQMLDYAGKDRGTNRIDLQHLMGKLGVPSQIIEVDGSLTKEKAYEAAKYVARKFNLPVITDIENLDHLKAVNKEADMYRKTIVAAIKGLSIPSDLKTDLLERVTDTVENWRGWRQML